jgi:hypothetical protein
MELETCQTTDEFMTKELIHTTLKEEQGSPGEWRQLRPCSVAKLNNSVPVNWGRAIIGSEVLPWP